MFFLRALNAYAITEILAKCRSAPVAMALMSVADPEILTLQFNNLLRKFNS
jgi:hypothetical protein